MDKDDDFAAMVQEDIKRELALAPDKLEYLRNKVIEKRDLDQEITELEELLSKKKIARRNMEREVLPTLFLEAGVPLLGLDAKGNQPACTYELKEYYYANISAEWEESRREDGFECLEKMKLGDLIKNNIEVNFGRGEDKISKKVQAALKKLKVPFTIKRKVQWNTLTSAVKEHYENDKPLTDTQIRLLGADVGYIVKLKPPKRERK